MNAADFKAGLVALWGDDWRKEAPGAFGVNVTTIDRWVTPEGKPNHAKVHPTAVKLLEQLQAAAARRAAQRKREDRHRAKKGGHHG